MANDTQELDALFSNIQEDANAEAATVEGDTPVVEGAKKTRGKSNPIQEIARHEILSNPALKDVKSTQSQDLEVTDVYCTYILKNIKPDKSQLTADGKYKRVPTSYKVGYKVKNVSDNPITYLKPNYVLNEETGQYEDHAEEATMAPGEEVILDRMNMTKLVSRTEFSLMLRNGRVKKSSKSDFSTVEELLRSYYFTFDDKSGKTVNDDDVNIVVDDVAKDGTRTVKAEFLSVFGFIMNQTEKSSGSKAAKEPKTKISTQEATALAIQAVIRGEAPISAFNNTKV